MGLVSRKSFQNSDLWDIHTLPSGAGAYILSKNGKPFYQVGFEISGVRLTQSDAELSGIYQKLVSLINSLPPGTRLRVIHMVDSNLKETLDQFDEQLDSQDHSDYAQFFLTQNKLHVESLLSQGRVIRRRLVALFTYDPNGMINDKQNFVQRLALMGVDWFYTAIGGASNFDQMTRSAFEQSMNELEEFRDLCFRMLRSSGMQVTAMSPWELWKLGYERNHPNTSKVQGVPPFPTEWRTDERSPEEKRQFPLYQTPRELIYSQEPEFQPDYVYIDGQYVAAVTLRSKPKEGTFPLLVSELLGFSFDYEVVVDLVVEEPNQAKGKLALMENTIVANINTSTTVSDVNQQEKLEEVRDAKIRLNRNREKIVTLGIAVLPKADSPSELDKHCQAVESIFTAMSEAVGLRERNLAWQTFCQTAPDSVNPSSRRRTHSSSRATVLLPLNAPKKGDRKPLLSFLTPSGDLYKFDPFDGSNPNFNLGVFATSGHGKSVMVFMLLIGALIEEALITILDIGVVEGGGTYRPLCDLVGGSYVQFGSGVTSINPLELPLDLVFDEFDEKDFGDPNDQFAPPTAAQIYMRVREYAKALLYVMITNGKDHPQEQIIIGKLNQALGDFYNDPTIRHRIKAAHKEGMHSRAWEDYPTLRDFVAYIPNRGQEDEVAELMRLVLSGTYCSGLEGAIFNRPSNIDQDARMLVFDLKDVPQSMFEAVVVATNGAAIRRSYKRDGKLKFVVADEAGVLLKRRVVASLIAELFATGRKSGISTAFIAQDYAQAMRSEAWSDLKANMNNVFFGACYPQTLETVEAQMQMPHEIVQELAGPAFKRNRLEGYSPWLHIKGGNEYEVIHCVPPISLLWLAANDTRENAIKKRYLQTVKDPFLALQLLASDYPQLAEGGQQNQFIEQYIKKYQEVLSHG